MLPPAPDRTEGGGDGGVPHGQLLPRQDLRLGPQLHPGGRVGDRLQVVEAGVGEEGDHGVDCPALPRYQRHRVGLQHSVHVLNISQAHPVQAELLTEEGEHDLHGLDDLSVGGPLLPVVHQPPHHLPLVGLVSLQEEKPEESHGRVYPVVTVVRQDATPGEEKTLLVVVRTVLAPSTAQWPPTPGTGLGGLGAQLEHQQSVYGQGRREKGGQTMYKAKSKGFQLKPYVLATVVICLISF